MGKKFDIELALRGKDEGAEPLVDRMTKKLRLMAKEEKLSGESLLAGKLKSGEGALDVVGNLAGVAKFGLIAAGASLAAGAISGMTKKLREMDELHLSGMQKFAGLVGELPVLGEITHAFADIYGYVSGQDKVQAEVEKSLERQTKTTKLIGEMDLKRRDIARELKQDIERSQHPFATSFENDFTANLEKFENMRDKIKELKIAAAGLSGKAQSDQLILADDMSEQNEKRFKAGQAAALARMNREQMDLEHKLTLDLLEVGEERYEAIMNQDGVTLEGELAAIARGARLKKQALIDAMEQADRAGKLTHDARESFTKLIAAAEKDSQLEEDRTRRQAARQEADVESELRQKQLESQGDHLGAQIAQINHSYEERIRLAKTAGEKEALGRAEGYERKSAIDDQRQADKLSQLDRERREARNDIEEHSARGRVGVEFGTAGRVAGVGSHAEQMKLLAELQVRKLDRLIEVVQNAGKPGGISKDAVSLIQVKR